MQIDLVLLNLELLYVFLILFSQSLREKEPDDSFYRRGFNKSGTSSEYMVKLGKTAF